MAYIIGIDTGGTFTDCIVMDAGGGVTAAKAPSTPDDFSEGVMESLRLAGERLGLTTEALLRDTARLALGTTVGTNAMLQRRGARVGLITTKGHRDVIHIMRGARGVPGLNNVQVLHFPESGKPDPIVPKPFIAEVSERVDCKGQVVVELNEAEAEAAIRTLVAKGVEAIAICFLWSFKHMEHERRVKAIVERTAPNVFVCCSADLIPRWGEYERTVATVLNAYLGPVMSRYLGRLESRAHSAGFRYPLQVMQCGGGVIPAAESARRAFLTLDSGPVAGVLASQYLGGVIGAKHIIATDMGGTSFDVGLVWDGAPVASYQSVVHQYEYFVPRIDIRSIGSGGGSIVWTDDASGAMRVGPISAGAQPGPAGYGRGGTQPTVTDADVVLGYFDPDYFLGGRLRLDVDAARASLAPIATKLGMGLVETAAGAVRVVEHQMADLIRKVTVQKGYDPRDCVVFAYGGAGPVHAGVYARELGAQGVVVPLAGLCSLWSALGAASADLLHIYEAVDIQPSPFDPARVTAHFAALEQQGLAQLRADGIDPTHMRLARSADVRYKGQINEVEVPLTSGPLDDAVLAQLVSDFHRRYETVYGRGAGFREARVEIVTYRVRASAVSAKPRIVAAPEGDRAPTSAARAGTRPVYWAELGDFESTPVFWGERLTAGNVVPGPAIIQAPDTTIVVHPFESARIDPYGNVLIDLGGGPRNGPPHPPALGSAPAEPWRSSTTRGGA
ncbi:MAG: hydantoinase/oxoprolinase family protein [Candidatus Rokubacteria bacterium]|nr:hydantoinase/oxoprolinase family protein [Candidatus Rokubacteria bacterium]